MLRFVCAVLLWVGVLLIPAASDAVAPWDNEPAGSANAVECGFPISGCGAGWYDAYSLPTVSDSSGNPLMVSPPNMGEMRLNYTVPCDGPVAYPKDCAVGGGQVGYISNLNKREMYLGAIFEINPEYGCSSVGTSKTFFMRAFDATFGGPKINGVFLMDGCGDTKRFIFNHNTGDQPGYPALHNEHACPQDPFNGLLCYPNMSAGGFTRGTKIKFEACIRASTSMTSRDAVVRWWINGVEAGRYTNLNYGAGIVNQWDWTPTWDGWGNGQGFTMTVWQRTDHVRVSFPPDGGCAASISGGSPPPPTPPPPGPTPPPPPPPPPPGSPGTVSDVAVSAVNTTTASVQFTAVSDGTGNPAKYDIRIMRDVMNWGAAQSVSAGTCTVPFAPGVQLQLVSCSITGLTPTYTYKVQLVPFRGTMNLDAVYGSLSNVGSVTMAGETPPPTPPPPTPPPTPPSPPPGLSIPSISSLLSTGQFRVVKGSDVWELRGAIAPYVLYHNGVCTPCTVVGHSIVYSNDLETIGVEFIPGKYQYLDTDLNEWVVISGGLSGVSNNYVTGTFTYAGTIPAGFNVYRSDSAGGTKERLPIFVSTWNRTFTDPAHAFGCFEIAAYGDTGTEGTRSPEVCAGDGSGPTRNIGQITPRKVIDFAGVTWELQGGSAPYVMYHDGVCECTLAGYSLRYKSGVVEMEYLPGRWVRRDATLNEWVITEP